MKYLLGCLLLSSLTSWGISWTSVVTQPPSVTVTEGDTVHIHCCWNLNMTIVKVNWLKDSTQIVDDLNHNRIIVNNRPCLIGKSVQTAAFNCSTMIISNVTRNDSGTYFCKITTEIPHFFQSVGNGTNLTVTSIDDTNNDTTVSVSELPLQISTSIMVLLLLLTTIVCLYRVQKRHQERPLRLIHEVPHHEEEELKMEELGEAANQSSTSSSRSSTQWCQVQVYESIDYLAKPTQGNG